MTNNDMHIPTFDINHTYNIGDVYKVIITPDLTVYTRVTEVDETGRPIMGINVRPEDLI